MTWLLAAVVLYFVVAVLFFIFILKEGVYRIEGILALFLIPTFWPLWLLLVVLAFVVSLFVIKGKTKKPRNPEPKEVKGNFRKPRDLPRDEK